MFENSLKEVIPNKAAVVFTPTLTSLLIKILKSVYAILYVTYNLGDIR